MAAGLRTLIVTSWLSLSAAGALSAAVQTYDLGPAEGARFALEVYKTRLMAGKKHVFVFERYGGEATIDDERPEDAKIRFVVEAASVVCTDTWVSEGDRKKILAAARNDVMAADKYPQLVFESTKVIVKSESQYDVEGMMTIRGRAKLVVVHITRRAGEFDGEATLKLSDFGLKAPTGMTMGFIGTKDEMKVLFHLIPKLKAAR